MRVAHLDCATGISGDMTLAALIDSGVDADAIRAGIDSLSLEGVRLRTDRVIKGGFAATYVRVEHPEQHAHRNLDDIHTILDRATSISDSQKQLARQIFEVVAVAEATVHGTTIDKVHFHEVGAIDSIVDVVGAAIGFHLLGAERVTCSAIPTGYGQVRIDHGICTIPTPGTAEILKGIPLWSVPVEGELTTPTGAAIVKAVVDSFDNLPEMTIESIGYGAGTMDLPGRANLLRIFVGQAGVRRQTDRVVLLETNLDDVSAEVIGHTTRRLFDAGALDVFSTAIQMKKNRPGTLLSTIARPADAQVVEAILFSETGTLGIRRTMVERSVRARRECTVRTVWGNVRGKRGWRAGERPTFAPEFEACAEVAAKHGVPLRDVYRAAEAAFAAQDSMEEVARQGEFSGDGHSHDHGHRHDHDGHHHDHDGHHHDHDGHHHDHG